MTNWASERRKMIRKADRLARKHDRAFYVLSAGTRLWTHDSAESISDRDAFGICVQVTVYPDRTMRTGYGIESVDLAYC